ncbi:hypothetical protein F5Y01DRAFT_287987 [Xylaria sp. FL0043]|nr:hypothetical protein F5Y01DRAFT_287987 [Xylaria sp. FL0043]
MGLSKTHRFTTRTYTIKNKVTASPRYLPPEVQCEGILMGRTFDIWTLGCVFFEFLIWLHGGIAKLESILEDMMSPSIRGSHSTDEYFEWVRVLEDNSYAIRIKEVVTQCIEKLQSNCTQFAYDFLEIIANQMLVVDRNERISAKKLAEEMEKLSRKCNERDYCVRKRERQVHAAPGRKLYRGEFREDLETGGKDNIPQVSSDRTKNSKPCGISTFCCPC